MSESVSFVLNDVKIPSESSGWNLGAWKFTTTRSKKPHAVIIMAPGFSATKQMRLAIFAETFAGAGYACIVFDYRRWGESDGSPRNCLYITEQLEDYRSVVKWVRHQRDLDAKRVVLWGANLGGGHIVTLAAEHHLKLACAIGICPFVGTSISPSYVDFFKLARYGLVDLLRQAIGLSPLYVPAYAKPGGLGAFPAEGTVEGMQQLAEDKRHWLNETSASSTFQFPFYSPASTAAKIACPLLLIIPEKDSMFPPEAALDVVKLSQKARMIRTVGSHFDVYPGGPSFTKALKAVLDFLAKHVPVS